MCTFCCGLCGLVSRVFVKSAFFQIVREHVPAAIVNTLVTDDGEIVRAPQSNSIYNKTYYTDPVAFKNVYPTAIHLLCRWHVDRYQLYCHIWKCVVYTGSIVICTITFHRAWQRKLVQSSDHRKGLSFAFTSQPMTHQASMITCRKVHKHGTWGGIKCPV